MQVPVIVSGEDLESRADGESNQRHIWILESYAIDVVALRAGNRAAHSCIAGDETVENRRISDAIGDAFLGARARAFCVVGSMYRRRNQRPNQPGVISSTGPVGLPRNDARIGST